MKKTTRLLLVIAAPLLTAAPASAWHHHRMAAMPMMPMMSMPMMPMPMMGMGVMPTMPMMGMGMMPTVVGGGGMSMQFSMSGDLGTALMMSGLLRNLLGQFLNPSATAGMTEAQIQALASRFAAALAANGAAPMTGAQADKMIQEMQMLRKQFQDNTNAGKDNPTLPKPKPSSPEVEQARAAVRQLVAKGARTDGRRLSVPEARAAVRQLVAKGTARKNGPTASDLEKARAEVRRLVAEGAARKDAAPRPPAVIRVAGDAR